MENKTTDKLLELTMDCEGSTNTRSHIGSLQRTVTVPPGEVELIHHLSPTEAHNPWGWTYSLRFVQKPVPEVDAVEAQVEELP